MVTSSPDPARRFTTTRTSDLRRILTGVVVSTLFELPLLHWVLVAWLEASWPWHVLVAALHVAVIVWIVLDYRAIRDSGHTVDDAALHLHLGTRWRGTVPRANLTTVVAEACELDNPLDGPPDGVARITPYDTPNVRLVLDAPVTLAGWRGRPVEASELWLFVDEPDALVAALG